MNTEQLLEEISSFCRRAGMAESTFGRRVVNDGKLVQRLRHGGRITTDTLDRIRNYLTDHPNGGSPSPATSLNSRATLPVQEFPRVPAAVSSGQEQDPQQNFRFFDNRQKYLLFVNTCSEKQVVSGRVTLELANIHPRPPAVRIFDAGVGDGTVLSRVLRSMHRRFTHMPFYVSGKEISLEDVRLTLDKMPDRLFEHPATVFVLTNMYYGEAPWLTVKSPAAANSMVWHEVALTGNTSREFEEQIGELQPFLNENWKARVSEKSGNPVYDRPVVLVLYRDDHRFLLDPIIPHPGRAEANFDLVIASQPYRARSSTEFKAKKVIAPLARALRPGGRLIAIHSHGNDPGMEIVHKVWPGENPFVSDRHSILRAVKQELGSAGRDLNFNAYADNRSIFQYKLETLPNEVTGPLGTSTAFAAWNAAVYVAQIEDERLTDAVKDGTYLEVTGQVLNKHGGLWFNDESYVISRQRD
jgi:SAM-dependent methyltransferase